MVLFGSYLLLSWCLIDFLFASEEKMIDKLRNFLLALLNLPVVQILEFLKENLDK